MSETSKSDSSKADKPGTDKPKSDKPKTDKPKVERAKGPLDAFRDFVGQWERGVNQIANEAMGNEQFSRLMHGVTSTAAGARAGLGEAMERYLATLNLPSRADITNIGERLQAIEAQLNRLTEIVAQMASIDVAPPTSAPKPKRTRKPPARPAADKSEGSKR